MCRLDQRRPVPPERCLRAGEVYQWSITESISDGGAYLSGDPNAPTIDLTGTTPDDIITATLIVTDSSGLSSQPFSQTTTVGPYGP